MELILSIVVLLILVGFTLWVLGSAPFIDAEMKGIIRWVILVLVGFWLLSMLLGYAEPIPFPRFRT